MCWGISIILDLLVLLWMKLLVRRRGLIIWEDIRGIGTFYKIAVFGTVGRMLLKCIKVLKMLMLVEKYFLILILLRWLRNN